MWDAVSTAHKNRARVSRAPRCKKILSFIGNAATTQKLQFRRYSHMTKVNPYHTNSLEYPPEHRNVYHDHDDCPDGKKIMQRHREAGTGGKPRCKVCIRL